MTAGSRLRVQTHSQGSSDGSRVFLTSGGWRPGQGPGSEAVSLGSPLLGLKAAPFLLCSHMTDRCTAGAGVPGASACKGADPISGTSSTLITSSAHLQTLPCWGSTYEFGGHSFIHSILEECARDTEAEEKEGGCSQRRAGVGQGRLPWGRLEPVARPSGEGAVGSPPRRLDCQARQR